MVAGGFALGPSAWDGCAAELAQTFLYVEPAQSITLSFDENFPAFMTGGVVCLM